MRSAVGRRRPLCGRRAPCSVLLATVLLVAVAVCALSTASFAAKKAKAPEAEREYLFLYPIYNMGAGAGFSISDSLSFLSEISEILESELGLSFTYDVVGTGDMSYDAAYELLAEELLKRGDFTYIPYKYYKKARELGAPVRPLAAPTMGGKKTYRNCLYVHRDSGFKTVRDLEGRKLAGEPGFSDVMWDDFNYMGIDRHPDEIFDRVETPDFQSRLYAVVMDEADVVYDSSWSVRFFSLFDTRFKRLVPLACGRERLIEQFIIYRETVPRPVVEKLSGILENFAKLKAFRKLPFYSAMKKMEFSFAPVTEEDLKALEKQEQEIIKEKKEFEAWMAEYEKRKSAGGKGDYKACKKKCAGAEDKEACMDECMK
ncbi:MAG: PhnD/SsuA/transferrin family substrate-binding protein [bacterium]